MLVSIASSGHLEEIVRDHALVFVDFWAEWCAPCKQFAKVYERVAAENPSIVFANVNIEQHPDLAETFQILSIPHLLIFKQTIVIYSESGSMPESRLKELVAQAIDVDVSAIKAQMDAEK
jgi:thioredoxin 1